MCYDRNYDSDPRVRAGRKGDWFLSLNENTMMAEVRLYDEYDLEDRGDEPLPEGVNEDGTVTVPFLYEVCSTCDGKGKHVNPSIDCDGLTSDDFDRDPDFAEEYFGGAYDVQCYGCRGTRVEAVIDDNKCDPAILDLLERKEQGELDYQMMVESERRMGC